MPEMSLFLAILARLETFEMFDSESMGMVAVSHITNAWLSWLGSSTILDEVVSIKRLFIFGSSRLKKAILLLEYYQMLLISNA